MLYDFNYFVACVKITYYCHLNGLWGHDGLQTASIASQVIFDWRFEITDVNYPGIYVHAASNRDLGDLWGNGGLQMASEVKSDLKFELSDLNFICCNVYLINLYLKKSISKEEEEEEEEAKVDMLTCVLRRR